MRQLNRTCKIADSAFCWVIAALICLPPFALGAVHPWPSAIVEVLAALLIVLLALKLRLMPARDRESGIKRWRLQTVPIFLLAGLFIFQLIPLPPAVIQVISPSTYNIYRRSFKSFSEVCGLNAGFDSLVTSPMSATDVADSSVALADPSKLGARSA
jgi:hypothetical protein